MLPALGEGLARPPISLVPRSWPRRPEEWVSEAFVFPWSEAMAKGGTNRPPRKLMWVEHKASSGDAKGGRAFARYHTAISN